MPWDEQRAKQRVADHDFRTFDVHVADLSREMDFHRLGTKDVRRAHAAHLYADVPNFHQAVADAGGDTQKLKKLARAASMLRRVQADLLAQDEIGALQLQAIRLHSLVYKPYDDETARAQRAVVLAVSLHSYLYDVFNDVFRDVRDFEGAVSIAVGESLIANIGFHGERELISLGSCANMGAKSLGPGDTITMTKEVYALLPGALQEYFDKAGTVAGAVIYRATGLRWCRVPRVAEALGVRFHLERLKRQTEAYRDALPLADMEISGVQEVIDLDRLSERRSKKTSAVALYADLDGFTRYVREAEHDEDVVSLVRVLHMIRIELHAVVKQDYPGVGLVLQHQGDRLFAIVHMPPGDSLGKRCANALNIAIGMQSSMEHALNAHLQERKDIHIAMGLDVGTVLVTRLGKKGQREVICLGPRVTAAEVLQLRSAGQEIRIAESIHTTIDNAILKEQFRPDGRGAYVAKRLPFPRLDEIEEAAAAQAGLLAASISTFASSVATRNRCASLTTKLPFVAAMNVLLFGFMATHFESLKAMYLTYGVTSAAFWGSLLVLILYLSSSMISLLFAVLGVMPQFGALAPQSAVFFGHIAKNYGKDYEKYVRTTRAMTGEAWARDLGTQIVEVSHIALAKHQRVRKAAVWVLITAGLWVLAFVVLLVMTPVSPNRGTRLHVSTWRALPAPCCGSVQDPCLRDGAHNMQEGHQNTFAFLDLRRRNDADQPERTRTPAAHGTGGASDDAG